MDAELSLLVSGVGLRLKLDVHVDRAALGSAAEASTAGLSAEGFQRLVHQASPAALQSLHRAHDQFAASLAQAWASLLQGECQQLGESRP